MKPSPPEDAGMSKRRIHDDELHAHFITFSCYRRRRLLDHDGGKRILLGVLNSQLDRRDATCAGFVVMPDHVHAIVWFAETGQLSEFMKQWKRLSSFGVKRFLHEQLSSYSESIYLTEPVWQPKYYSFNLYSREKTLEKLQYMHENPVRAGLVRQPTDWPWSSARHYEQGKSVGVPISWVE